MSAPVAASNARIPEQPDVLNSQSFTAARNRVSGSGGEGRSVEDAAPQGEVSHFAPIPVVEITPLPIDLPGIAPASELVTVEVPVHRASAGRGGARSGRVAPIKAESAAVPTAVALEPQAATPSEPAASEADDTGEPRRRRRRSSAAG
jgi:ribonuclease E